MKPEQSKEIATLKDDIKLLEKQLKVLEKRVGALEKSPAKSPAKKKRRKLLVNLEVLNQYGKTAQEQGESNESRIQRATKKILT